jgi:energy-converting hydrogenase Eha subunit F
MQARTIQAAYVRKLSRIPGGLIETLPYGRGLDMVCRSKGFVIYIVILRICCVDKGLALFESVY